MKSFTKRGRVVWVAGAIVLLTAAGVGVAYAARPPAQPLTAAGLFVSDKADRSTQKKLGKQPLSGNVFITAVADGLVSAAFRLDDPLSEPLRIEKEAPFDFAGGAADGSANPFDTSTIADGPHAVLVDLTMKDGTELSIYARFIIDNTSLVPPSAPPSPSQSPIASPSTSASARPSPPGGRTCPAFPTPACTGVPPGKTLTAVNGDLVATTPGQIVDGKRITGRLVVAADNVTIRNTEIVGGVTNYYNGKSFKFTITDSTIGAASGCNGYVAVGASEYTATRVHIHNFGDGFRVSGSNIVIQDSFVKLCSNPGDHSDGVQGYLGGSNVVVRHNTIDQRGAKDVTSPIFFADESKGAIVRDNLLAGGGYTLRLHGNGFTASGNRIVKDAWIYGPVNSDCAGVTWSDNALVTIDAGYVVTSVSGPLRC